MAKRSRLLFYWEPYTLSAEVYDDLGKLTQSSSVLIVETKTTAQLFSELLSSIKTKKISETSLLIRQTNVKLNQFSIPALKQRDKVEFLNQKLKKEWDEEELFYWGQTKLKSESKVKESIQTFSLPRIFIDEFIKVSKQMGALPLRAFTTHSLAITTSVNHSTNQDESIFLYDDENSILLVMVSKNQPVLLREMPFSNFLDKEEEFLRLSKEIQRTWLYAKQQYKFFPTRLKICGSDLFNHKDVLAGLIDDVSVEQDEQQDWKSELLSATVIDSTNLIPRRIQLIQRTIRIAHIWAILLTTLISITIFWEVYNRGELSALNDKIQSENLIPQSESFQSEITHKIVLKDSIQRLLDQENLIKSHTNSPIPAWILMYLSENIPNDLVLSHVKITRIDNSKSWKLSIQGNSPRNPVKAAQILESFDSQTQSDFGKLNLEVNWKVSWLKNLHSGRTMDIDDLIQPFLLEGVLQE